MAMARDEKKNAVADHLGAIRSYAQAIALMAKSMEDTKTMCAFDMIAESIAHEAESAECRFDELMEGGGVAREVPAG